MDWLFLFREFDRLILDFDLIYDLKILMDYIRIFNSLVEILDKIDMF